MSNHRALIIAAVSLVLAAPQLAFAQLQIYSYYPGSGTTLMYNLINNYPHVYSDIFTTHNAGSATYGKLELVSGVVTTPTPGGSITATGFAFVNNPAVWNQLCQDVDTDMGPNPNATDPNSTEPNQVPADYSDNSNVIWCPSASPSGCVGGNSYPTWLWERSSGSAATPSGNAAYFSGLTCNSYAKPSNTLSTSATSITSGSSATITWNDNVPRDTLKYPTGGEQCAPTAPPENQPYVLCTASQTSGSDFTTAFTSAGATTTINYGSWDPELRKCDRFLGNSTTYFADAKTGSATVSPTQTTTYTYTCSNENGTTTSSVAITVGSSSGSCAATTLSNCVLPSTPSGSSAGSCATGYSGSCSYKCSSGTWSKNSNTCSSSVADLLATGTISPWSIVAGTPTYFSSTIKNQGTAATTNTFPVLYQAATSSLSTIATNIGVDATTSVLAASSSESSTMDTTYATTTSLFYVRACANTKNNSTFVVPESNYNNNCGAWSPISVSAATIDLTATTSVAYTGPVYTGQAMSYSEVIGNIGNTSTGTSSFPVLFQWANTSSGGGATNLCNSATTCASAAALGAGYVQESSGAFSYATSSPGTFYIRACANTVNNSTFSPVSETNTSNNCGAWTAVTVTNQPCSATTINGCTLPTTTSGSSAGSCAALYGGTCKYTCNSGTWTKNSNFCIAYCPGTTINNCTLPTTSTGSSAGSCATGYTGSCNYTCNTNTWSQNTNTCAVAPTACSSAATPTLSANPTLLPKGNSGTTLAWKISNALGGCTLTDTSGGSYSVPTPADCNSYTGSVKSNPITGPTTFTLTCSNGTASAKATAKVGLNSFVEF